ncbi:hypothetical protein J2808_004332 [Pseudarthrobacter sulfonivorans]|nr:hypothetical protein [Pseudarthrobacter sulfonivorans]
MPAAARHRLLTACPAASFVFGVCLVEQRRHGWPEGVVSIDKVWGEVAVPDEVDSHVPGLNHVFGVRAAFTLAYHPCCRHRSPLFMPLVGLCTLDLLRFFSLAS